MYPKTIQKLIEIFSKFPTIGPRTAGRIVFYLINQPQKEIEELVEALRNLKKEIKICSFCFNPFEGEGNLCPICADPSREKSLLCVVEKEIDLLSIENTKKYHGLYFILGGTVSKLRKEDIKKLRIKELEERIKNFKKFGMKRSGFNEIILATNFTTEGEATAKYLEKILKPLKIKITRLGRGLPVGAELEYSDEETLLAALESRK